MINIIICEGKKSERVILNDYINTFFYNYNFEYNIKEFENGGDLLKKYPNNVDIIFMDIDLNDENGFNVSKEIKKFDESVRIIFVSSSNKYIKKGYEIGVYRYLEKPLKYSLFKEAISSYLKECYKNEAILSIKCKCKIYFIKVDDILYLEVLKNDLTIHTEKGIYTFKSSMKEIESNLEEHNFFRCHKSYLINLMKVNMLENNIVFINQNSIIVSRYKIKLLREKLNSCLVDVII